MKHADNLFNLFRYRFYKRFEQGDEVDVNDDPGKNSSTGMQELFIRVRNLILIVTVLPVGSILDFLHEHNKIVN